MNSISFLPTFFQQCCDAISLQKIGEKCALYNDCYTDVRPGGAGYWFSLPTRFGLPDSSLIYTNIALLLLSSLLSCLAIFSIQRQKKPIVIKICFAMASVAIHGIFLWPTLFTSLSDPPSALLMLNGIWLLLLSRNTNSAPNLMLIVVGSSMLGLAAWIRSFYFYPLLASIAIGCIGFYFLLKEHKKISHVLILSALLFPGVQIMHTYKTTGKIAYIYTAASNNWINTHLGSKEIGYDTVLPELAMYSRPQYCNINSGLLVSLKTLDYSSLLCLLTNRAAFYLSTYKSTTFIDKNKPKNLLSGERAEDINGDATSLVHNLDIQWNAAIDPFGNITAAKLQKKQTASTDIAYVAQWITLPGDTEYTFSVWLWAEHPKNIEIAFSRHRDNLLIAKKNTSVTTQPQRFFVSGKTQDANDYNVSIGNMPFANDSIDKSPMPATFYAWGAQLEVGSLMTEYSDFEAPNPELLRPQYPLLLAANIIAIFTALLFMVRKREVLLTNPAHLVAVSIMVFSFAQALIVIPEQRFIVACMIFIWLLAVMEIINAISRRLPSPNSNHSTQPD